MTVEGARRASPPCPPSHCTTACVRRERTDVGWGQELDDDPGYPFAAAPEVSHRAAPLSRPLRAVACSRRRRPPRPRRRRCRRGLGLESVARGGARVRMRRAPPYASAASQRVAVPPAAAVVSARLRSAAGRPRAPGRTRSPQPAALHTVPLPAATAPAPVTVRRDMAWRRRRRRVADVPARHLQHRCGEALTRVPSLAAQRPQAATPRPDTLSICGEVEHREQPLGCAARSSNAVNRLGTLINIRAP